MFEPMPASPTPVLLIHGIDDTAQGFHRMEAYLRDRPWPQVHTLDLHPNNGDAGLGTLAQQIQTYAEAHLTHYPRFDLVSFSMGGIVSRYYVQRLGGRARVRQFVTLSSPHNGTWTGYLRQNLGAAQMRPNSEFLQDLNQTVDELTHVRFTSIWTPYDLMILLAISSLLPVGRMMQLPVLAHPLMLTDERSLATVAQVLAE